MHKSELGSRIRQAWGSHLDLGTSGQVNSSLSFESSEPTLAHRGTGADRDLSERPRGFKKLTEDMCLAGCLRATHRGVTLSFSVSPPAVSVSVNQLLREVELGGC